MNNKNYLVIVDNINHKLPFPATPWHLNAPGYRFHSYELKRDTPSIQINNYLLTPHEAIPNATDVDYVKMAVENIFKSVYDLNEVLKADNTSPANTQIYTMHSRNLLCRLLDRWARFKNLYFDGVKGAYYHDIVEVLNHPAVLTAEERFSFSYERLGITVGQPVPKDPIELVINTCQTFLQ
jgi:hypothetical protein